MQRFLLDILIGCLKFIEMYYGIMIFNICPCPEGCVENQFAPFRVWGEQINFP
jgi:hypothetical protein